MPENSSRPLTFDEACALTAGAAMWRSVEIPDAGVPAFTMADGPMGVTSGNIDEREVSLLTPCPTALGASWDAETVRKVGTVVGSDAIERGIDAVLAPNLNLARSPLAGRAFEYFSEDPLLAGVLGAAWIGGLQSTGTGAVAKHLVCNDSETERDRVNAVVDERTLREVYLLPFEMAAAAGCAGMLAAYNKVNGDWCSESTPILTDIVKREWGFGRVIMSDWFGTHSGAGCIDAGLDLEMPGPARFMGPKLADEGGIERDRVFAAANRVAATARQVTGPKSTPLPIEQAQAILEDAAAEGFVLLKNEGDLLPLAPGAVKRIAVIGPNAAAPCYQGGTFAKIAVAPDTPTPIDAIRARYGAQTEIIFEPGVDPQPRLPAMPMPMTVEYFTNPDLDGSPNFTETRTTNSLVWFQGQHTQSVFNEPGSIRATGIFTAEKAGVHKFYLGGTGTVRMRVDSNDLLATGGVLDAKDVMGTLKRGDADMTELALAAGQQIEVVVEFAYTGARCQGLWYGIRSPDSPEAMLARAIAAARDADAVFLIVGETSDSSVESKDRADTKLAPEQVALIEAVTAANPKTAIVANVGHAFDTSWEDRAAALMLVWYPGQGFAPALASVLAGDREPGGRMPVSIARQEVDYCGYSTTPDADGDLVYAEGVNFGYRGLIANGTPARHTLGSGMGYARFEWHDVVAEDGGVAVTVRNISDRAGSDVIQLYRDAPETALIGFAKVRLEPGEERRVVVRPEPKMLRRWQDGWQSLPENIPLRLARGAEAQGFPATLSG
ncbi:glycoside hydrolase family 3 C-terminal domain-containing protein [Sphingomonas sp. SUN039]|uniref:glycoside hydrolase family 3 protein n=1 Tax=Sphingomonas sp. SUN039 TaxID=2937787 RepID=UPI0021648B91|nr:glycoside hydrolase family 3 C-terminal domain-containing protein [Sphingomonas sp. SUN039]UVO53111.1 glycoside hydrolase family 3 C-terminal domain-containing protein [Sphingomonas sp. SUN039]